MAAKSPSVMEHPAKKPKRKRAPKRQKNPVDVTVKTKYGTLSFSSEDANKLSELLTGITDGAENVLKKLMGD